MNRSSSIGLCLAAAWAPALVAAPPGTVDYSRLPLSAEEELAALSPAVITLEQAIAMALASLKADFPESEPVAGAAWAETRDDTLYYLVRAYTNESKHEVLVNAEQGALDTRVSLSGAQVPGAPVPAGAEMHETPSGLRYIDLKEGTGASPAGPTSRVSVHYTGYLVNGVKFDSSVDRGQPIEFRLDRVIPGWTEGVQRMKVGGKRKLIIPFEMAYGVQGRPPVIPPRAMLVFDVELLGLPDGQ